MIAANSCSAHASLDGVGVVPRARSRSPRSPPRSRRGWPGCPASPGRCRPRRAGRRRGRGRRRRTSGASRGRSPRAPGGSRSSTPRCPTRSSAASRPPASARATSSASSTSPAVAAPNVVPRAAASVTASSDSRVGVAVDQRAPRAHPVDVAIAVDVEQLGALGALDEDRVAADRAHRAHRRVDAARQDVAARARRARRSCVSRDRGRRSDAGVLAFPVLEVVGEVQEADLLELGRASRAWRAPRCRPSRPRSRRGSRRTPPWSARGPS